MTAIATFARRYSFPLLLGHLAAWSIGFGLAVLFGLLATTAEPILVGLGAGTLVSVILLAKPKWTIWLLLLLCLFVVGLLPIWLESHVNRATWGISVLGFVLLARALVQGLVVPGCARRTPTFVWASLFFLVYVAINGLLQSGSAYEYLSGFKRYFQVIGLVFALAWLSFDENALRSWRKLFLVVALFQLPWAIYELIRLVPIREGLRYAYPSIIPIDVVAGTFGANMTGGGANAEMATFLIIILTFLLARLRERVFSVRKLFWVGPVILAPLFLGETKVVVVLLPLAFLTLYRAELLRRPHVGLAGLILGAVLTVSVGYAYLSITKKSLEHQVRDTISYNIQDKGYGGQVLNRTTVLTFWIQEQGLNDPVGTVFGHGLGSAHGQTGGKVAQRYAGYGIGFTAAATLLWEQGIFGALLFLSILVFAWRSANRLRQNSREPWVRADVTAIQVALILSGFYLIYRTALLEALPFQAVFYSLLGYLAWLECRERATSSRLPAT